MEANIMIKKSFLTVLFLALVFPVAACAHMVKMGVVDVRVLSDKGSEFAKYRTYPTKAAREGLYFYMEAVKGEWYSIEVKNRSDRRIGVVIAVDGRNIISGNKSSLKQHERMYIIEPYQTYTYEGWRTGMERTNRFYFTEQSDSYAEKVFSDASAMGTIALAVYREKLPVEPLPLPGYSFSMKEAPSAASPQAALEGRSSDRMKGKNEHDQKNKQAGTGFGETAYSPARAIHFEAEDTLAEKIVLKYEWRTELCKKGIVGCRDMNRLWPDEEGFAPVPKDFRG
jgi:hypothetical protein